MEPFEKFLKEELNTDRLTPSLPKEEPDQTYKTKRDAFEGGRLFERLLVKQEPKTAEALSPASFWALNSKHYDTYMISQTDRISFKTNDFYKFLEEYANQFK